MFTASAEYTISFNKFSLIEQVSLQQSRNILSGRDFTLLKKIIARLIGTRWMLRAYLFDSRYFSFLSVPEHFHTVSRLTYEQNVSVNNNAYR